MLLTLLIACTPKPAAGFRAQLTARLEQLAAHPRIEVMAAYFAPPLDAAGLARVEAHYGRPLDAPLRALFSETGGVQVLWRCVPARAPGPLPDPSKRYDEGADLLNRDGIDGFIEIDPIAWLPEDKTARREIDGEAIPWSQLRLFDAGSYYYAAALVVDPRFPEPRVVEMDDYYAHVEERSMSTQAYLDRLIATVGYHGEHHDSLCAGALEDIGLAPPSRPDRTEHRGVVQ